VENQTILILFGTVMGHAELVAEDLAAALAQHGIAATVRDMEDTDIALLAQFQEVIVCVSTTGNGEVPANAEPFSRALEARAPDLAGKRFAICGLGDRDYEPFYCAAAHAFAALFAKLGAVEAEPMFEFDGDPRRSAIEDAQQWVLAFATHSACVGWRPEASA
jgi:flavodoxin